MTSTAVTRIGDKDIVDGSNPTRSVGSPDVYVNNKKISLQGNADTIGATIIKGSTTVFCNNKAVGRKGDSVTGGSVIEGSPDVFCG